MAVAFMSCVGAASVSGGFACPVAAGLSCARSAWIMEDELSDVELAELVAVSLRQKGGLDFAPYPSGMAQLSIVRVCWAASPILRPRIGPAHGVASPLLIA